MAIVRELREQLEAALHDAFTGVSDASEVQTSSTAQTFKGNHLIVAGVATWQSGGGDDHCGRTHQWSTARAISFVHSGTCGTGRSAYPWYTITVHAEKPSRRAGS
jgi:hypothetical protein